ncbi:MAG TPA: HAD family hydrolase [Firmicutes bacterium]|nr:HAD family hydrolase [Candidatus Fermentithermobacillaceae bacterium]
MAYPGTVLFDLDGTLVPVDMDFFYKAYVKEVSTRFAPIIPPDVFQEALLKSTYEMISNLDPALTNHEAFARAFSRRVGRDWEEVWPVFQNFYRHDFGRLKRFVPENPHARSVVTQVLKAGWDIVLATNAVFPEIAIRERMRWVNIDDLPWKYITTLDNMHYCKPQLQYYEEILDILKLDPSTCVMVGNDVEEDMIAQKLGMKTFLVEDFLIERGGSGLKPDGKGKLPDLLPFLAQLAGAGRESPDESSNVAPDSA